MTDPIAETRSLPALSTNNTGVICGRIRGGKEPGDGGNRPGRRAEPSLKEFDYD